MNSWINLSAVGLILVLGLVFGAGLPALFAVGLRALNTTDTDAGAGSATASSGVGAARMAVAVVCFAVVLAAIVWGIYLIVTSS